MIAQITKGRITTNEDDQSGVARDKRRPLSSSSSRLKVESLSLTFHDSHHRVLEGMFSQQGRPRPPGRNRRVNELTRSGELKFVAMNNRLVLWLALLLPQYIAIANLKLSMKGTRSWLATR